MKYFSLIILSFLIISCEKSAKTNPALNGKWLLKKYYSDPGDGSGKYQNVHPDSTFILNIYENGSVSANTSFYGLNNFKSYMVLDSTRIQFNMKNHISVPSTVYYYSFIKDTLVLNPPCIEGCGLKFVRAENFR